MSLETMAAASTSESQVNSLPLGALMLDLEGPRLGGSERDLLGDEQVGGVILFRRNYRHLDQLRELVASIRAVKPNLLIAVDQEGGRVQRFQEGFTRLPPMQKFLQIFRDNPEGTLQFSADVGWLMAAELLSADIDISFAPVLDVDDEFCSVIADRSFSPDPEEVVSLAGAFMAGMHDAGMATTGKHFPGHGSVREDSHQALPMNNCSWDELVARDLIPFRQLQGRLDAVMPAHIIFSKIDDFPVGFSGHWLQSVLRDQLGFDGVIFSDDLSMSATESYGDYANRAELALQAGCDMVLVCNNRPGAEAVLDYLRQRQWPASRRLNRMLKRRQWSLNYLQTQPRWQQTVQRLRSFMRE